MRLFIIAFFKRVSDVTERQKFALNVLNNCCFLALQHNISEQCANIMNRREIYIGCSPEQDFLCPKAFHTYTDTR